MRKVPVPAILLLLAVLSCVFLVHGLYGLIELFGSPDLSPEATLLIFAFCFLVLAAAAAAGNRRALMPREAAADDEVVRAFDDRHAAALPTTGEEAAVGGEPLLADEEEAAARRMDLQTQDYPGSGANSRHDPRNPH
ncbi:hypothetical protein PR202_gb26966 [Eleusine coracana subsp. coracana]|uniref:Uncharacterized protein n=1 Tax=Eleusine coracana subsp. coracana TaxID=191504 RepID=A0AAV5FQB8_ELECO|nr:hypothetical protein PR202_gb26966 [Eleusine coracana subsp. coracana]